MPRIATNVTALVAFIEGLGLDATDAKSLAEGDNQARVFATLLNARVPTREQLHEGLAIAQPTAQLGDQHVGYYLSKARNGQLPGYAAGSTELPAAKSAGRKRADGTDAQPKEPKAPKVKAEPTTAAAESTTEGAAPAEPKGKGRKLDDADVPALQALAKANGVPTGGNAAQLRKRLKGVLGESYEIV